ncbi:membrane protein insertase YidC [Leekyejoonella antrihumi]|uniref:Membrane protein insertase YidC n=1 Tax=Leekyejoonella antrihumi TaxID=1660198 RepID=A0A563E6V7_9MICO|nr:membrane protein insertase YidC [Leekyejoonella antrihumi]TWP38256.1 membrane protein insertase YidC [Leekyejoonella antrihumi]
MIDKILFPLEWFVAVVMVGFHKFFTLLGMAPTGGLSWVLSIAGLVIVLRILLVPLFVKQIKSSRRMQLIQPEIQKIQKKYKGKKDAESRQKMTEEQMELYKRTGTNPFSSCMPIILQAPFFYALFRVLEHLKDFAHTSSPQNWKSPIGPLTQAVARQADSSTLFHAELSSSFLGSHNLSVKILSMGLIVIMAVTVFVNQQQLMRKNMPASALDNPFAKQQKYIMYAMPLFFFISGINFPIGVLIYWVVTNVWSFAQQYYVIRRMPAPGSPAEKEMEQRRRAKGKSINKVTIPGLHKSEDDEDEDDSTGVDLTKSKETASAGRPGTSTSSGTQAGKTGGGQRVQPKRNNKRRKR